MPLSPRLILLHKHRTSGRVCFLCLPHGVVAFRPLPTLAALRDEDYPAKIQIHPTALVREAETRLGMAEHSIAPEAEFSAWVDTPDGDVPILLATFADIDPPFAVADRVSARFIALTEALRLTEVERNLLRRAYEHVLG